MASFRLIPISRYHRLQQTISFIGSIRYKWLSGKDAKGPNVPVGSHTGHPDNPLYHTRDREYFGSPEKGDTIRPAFMYREFQANTSYIDRTVAYYISAFFWFWMFYHLYYFPGHIFGHHHAPYLEEFTDEELGIPDDNAPDPEYWGNHYEKPGTYR